MKTLPGFRVFSKAIVAGKTIVLLTAVLLLALSCSNPLVFQGDADTSTTAVLASQSSRNLGYDLPSIPEAQINETMYQFFYWDSYPGLWADLADDSSELNNMAEDLAAAGATMFWLPPAAKGMAGGFSVGYDVYDFWDLGEFNQKGTVATRYGTRQQLQQALNVLDGMGIDAIYDVVFNHRMGADTQMNVDGFGLVWTQFDLLGRDAYYTQQRWGYLWHDFEWDWTVFDGIDGSLFPYKQWDNTYHFAYLMGNDVDYQRYETRQEMKAWGEWIMDDVGFAGFRMDAIAHVDTDFTREWVNHMHWATDGNIFFVGEAWVGDLVGYLDAVQTPHMNVFDFGLREDFVSLSSGSKDMRWWGGLVNTHRGSQAVTFVDNHDTNRAGNPYGTPKVINYKNQAYAYILMREYGTPAVYARDYEEFGMAPTLNTLIEARRYFAYGPGHETSANSTGVYTYVREGLDTVPGTGLVMLISGRNSGGQGQFWINSRQPNTEFYDYTGNVAGTVTTNGEGYANFPVNITEATGWSIWVPVPGSGGDGSWDNAYFRGTPNAWAATAMTEIEPGVWQYTADFTGQTNPRFKIDRFGDWTEAYPEQDFLIGTPGTYVITFTESTQDISAVLQPTEPGDQITLRMTVDVGVGYSVFFTGTGAALSNWGTGVEGTWTSGNVWELTIDDPGNFEWKVRKGPTGGAGQLWEGGANHNQANLHPAFNGGF